MKNSERLCKKTLAVKEFLIPLTKIKYLSTFKSILYSSFRLKTMLLLYKSKDNAVTAVNAAKESQGKLNSAVVLYA